MVTRMTKAEKQKARQEVPDETNWSEHINTDRPGQGMSEPKKLTKAALEKITIRLHPDVLDKITEKADKDRRRMTDVLRDFIVKGMNTEGIYL